MCKVGVHTELTHTIQEEKLLPCTRIHLLFILLAEASSITGSSWGHYRCLQNPSRAEKKWQMLLIIFFYFLLCHLLLLPFLAPCLFFPLFLPVFPSFHFYLSFLASLPFSSLFPYRQMHNKLSSFWSFTDTFNTSQQQEQNDICHWIFLFSLPNIADHFLSLSSRFLLFCSLFIFILSSFV